MRTSTNLFLGFCFGFLALCTLPITAQPIGHTTLNVKGRVQLEVPTDWTIGDAEHRQRVKELSEQLTGVPTDHVASLSVQSYPAPSRVFVRVSFIPLDPPISQDDVRNEVRADAQLVLSDMAASWNQEAPVMWEGLAKYGVTQVGRPRFAIEPLGGQLAMVIRYGRTSTANRAETMSVAQYHVLLGSEKALITLSHIEGDAQATAAMERLKRSISIR
ncbi:MAG: hypothetical protein O9256_00665 [Rhizobiaceae bacterium]|nr:hypothetical protein [Rhizobiaceae bacterium]